MITVKLMGGLGNQMFQYACGRALSIKKGQPLCLDVTRFHRDKIYKRKFLLNYFNINYNKIIKPKNRIINIISEKKEQVLKKNNIVYEQRIESKSSQDFYLGDPVYSKTDFNSNISKEKDIILDGLWQSDCYFKDIENIIRDDFTLSDKNDSFNKEYYNSIKKDNSVCFGIRRYKEAYAYKKHYTLPKDYYEEAVKIIKKRINKPEFYIFTLDEDWARTELSFIKNPIFITPELYDSGIVNELILMSKARSFILPNSTYHWWGAWLSDRNDKIVIAPQKGWGNEESLIENWIAI